ncbi:MAG: nicotinate (nicotinamide) nucleotide adenylyltransferase [Clostridia bacterium]|nr:nicotinate (nicotinamide) nucleotide adenylyltransferase [Clostridia bacterium]
MNIGFMGGTFSPPHVGHLHSAKVFIEEMNLDRLIIIPAKVSPFKANSVETASDMQRLEMARLCFLPLDSKRCHVEVSEIEVSKNEISYTIETVKKLKELYPDDELFMFVGSDMFLSLEKWRDFENIFRECHVYTRCRERNEEQIMFDAAEKYKKMYNAFITLSKDREIIASSTEVRQALTTKNIQSCQNLLTDEVLGYIIKGGLYFEE